MINCQETFLGLANAPHSVPPRLTVEDQLGDRFAARFRQIWALGGAYLPESVRMGRGIQQR